MDKQYGFTPPGSDYPPYFNASLKDGEVILTVRSPKQSDGSCGVSAAMPVSLDVALGIADGIRSLAAEPPAAGSPLTEAQIKHMAEQFLRWKLPMPFNPDCGISFEPTYNNGTGTPAKHEPTGTNLFGYTEAEAMVRHMLEGLPTA